MSREREQVRIRSGRPVAASLGVALFVVVAAACARPPPPSSPSPPAVPRSGAYFGAWVNPASIGFGNRTGQYTQVQPFENSIGRRLRIDHHYRIWFEGFPAEIERDDVAKGRIPLVSWACGVPDGEIVAGQHDAFIAARAEEVRAFGSPIFIRWFWEMNLLSNGNHGKCLNGADIRAKAQGYVEAWRHIVAIFRQRGATNAAFVWCPTARNERGDTALFYPGDASVDWICADIYQRGSGGMLFGPAIRPFYDAWSSHNKPIMVGETGADGPAAQQTWIDIARASVPQKFPLIKAFVYWNAPGQGDYVLRSQGLASFATMGADPFFNP